MPTVLHVVNTRRSSGVQHHSVAPSPLAGDDPEPDLELVGRPHRRSLRTKPLQITARTPKVAATKTVISDDPILRCTAIANFAICGHFEAGATGVEPSFVTPRIEIRI
jgi:hypothetical protein